MFYEETPITQSYDTLPGTRAEANLADAQLVVAWNSRQPLAPSARISLGDVHEVVIGRSAEQTLVRRVEGRRRRLYLGLPDPWMSATHACLALDGGTWTVADAGSKNGTRLNGKPTCQAALSHGDVLEVGSAFLVFDLTARQPDEPALLDTQLLADRPAALVTLSLALARQLDGLASIAPSAVPVLVSGESGTGKELTVRALHDLSGRTRELVAINCGAIPKALIEAELFGCTRGAFSGANTDREGLVRAAHGGTLFLDEVAELPESSQATLLRVLQDGEVRAVGSHELHRVDVRIVAATHQDLEERVRDGRFRRDLYARLCGYRVDLPPLRERREDLGILIRAALSELAPDGADEIHFEPSAARALFGYDYPLNVRELRHALQTALALSPDGTISRRHLPSAIAGSPSECTRELSRRDQALRARVAHLLRAHHGNVSAVAREMGKAPVQIRRWCRRFEIDLAALRRRG